MVLEPPSPDRRRRGDVLRSAGHEVLFVDDAEAARAVLAQADAVVADDPGLAAAARLAGCIPVVAPGAGPEALADAVRLVLEDEEFDDASLQRMRSQFQGAFGGFVELFLRESRTRAGALQDGVAARDPHVVGREAHTLKPTCGMLGAKRLSRRCADVEAVCRDGWNDDLPTLCGDLLDDLARLRRRLEATGTDAA